MHFHGQLRGENGSVVFGQINPAQDAGDLRIMPNADGSWTVAGAWDRTDPANIPITDFAALLNLTPAGLDIPLYFNVHNNGLSRRRDPWATGLGRHGRQLYPQRLRRGFL
jgi:hypothetical protein